MNGQAKALIPALIGIITLLLTGITGIAVMPGEKQATYIAETRAVTLEQYSHQSLGAEFRADADAAARSIGLSVAADKAGVFKGGAPLSVAQATTAASDQG